MRAQIPARYAALALLFGGLACAGNKASDDGSVVASDTTQVQDTSAYKGGDRDTTNVAVPSDTTMAAPAPADTSMAVPAPTPADTTQYQPEAAPADTTGGYAPTPLPTDTNSAAPTEPTDTSTQSTEMPAPTDSAAPVTPDTSNGMSQDSTSAQ